VLNKTEVFCYGEICYEGSVFPPLPPANIIELEVLEANATTTQITAQILRSSFRAYFYYAIAGDGQNPLAVGSCSSKCYSLQNHCCMFVNATDSNSGLIIEDNLCMSKLVTESQSSITLNSNKYTMSCQGSRTSSGIALAIK
jgi:hypothetical protein